MANLAIKSHATRSREVIELLEMLGGYQAISFQQMNQLPEQFIVFTLEEFLEKFPYKVGDKIKDARIEDHVGTIIKAQWDDYEEEVVYTVIWDDIKELSYFAKDLQPYKEGTMEDIKSPLDEYDKLSTEKTILQKTYLIDKIIHVDNDILVEFVERLVEKKLYPNTYEECYDIVDYKLEGDTIIVYEAPLFRNFQQLLICRDVYWKIAGEQMGLGKPWEPDWSTNDDVKYVIEVYRNNVRTNSQCYSNATLAFPSKEMRDAFYDNFKDLIENCKELL